MTLESNSLNRCPTCRMLTRLCICSAIPRLETKTRVVVAMHIAEKNKPSNTARLLKLALPNCEVVYQGIQDQPLDLSSTVQDKSSAYLLFPESSLSILDLVGRRDPITLVVPDGTWQQAKKIASHITTSLSIPRISIPDVGPSRYKLRHADRAGRLSTLEAVAHALGILEGSHVQQQLDQVFGLMVDRVIESRNGRKG